MKKIEKKNLKKLTLAKETVRDLASMDLKEVKGGRTPMTYTRADSQCWT